MIDQHRGGMPGFVERLNDRELVFRDYPGNNMFQTLGNLTADPRTRLVFIDFDPGSTLQLSGQATIGWGSTDSAPTTNAQRTVRFRVDRLVQTPGALPLRWDFKAYSRHNPG